MAYVHPHVEFQLFYKRNWPLSLLVVLVFEKSSLFFFFHYFISTVASTFCAFLKSVHWNYFLYVDRCACSGFVVCSLFPSLVANLLKRVL